MKPHRDSIHHVPAHVVVFHRLRRLFGVRHSHVLHKGAHHPVNAHWHAANTDPWPHLAGRSRHELETIKDGLILKSDSTPLTKDEHAYLHAVAKHFNVRTKIDFLAGRDHREFGFGGVDQVKGVGWDYPCGCKLVWAVDHYKALAGTTDKHHPHAPRATCRHHDDHAQDLDLLHEYVADDNGNSDFVELLKQEREAEKRGLPLPPKWVRPIRGA